MQSFNKKQCQINKLYFPLKADFMTPSEQLFKERNWLPKRVQYHSNLPIYTDTQKKKKKKTPFYKVLYFLNQ